MATQLCGGNPDGYLVGQSDDKLGFYGLATPIVKPTISLGFATSASVSTATACATALLAIKAGLVALGLCA
jgi:hypothetical protein